MSKKRKVQETNLPVQSKRTESSITANVTIPTVPLSAFAAARAKAKTAASDLVDHVSQDQVVESSSAGTSGISKPKKLKTTKSYQLRTPASRKEKENKPDQDYAIDPEDVFSQLSSSSKHPMPQPYELPDQDQDYGSNDSDQQKAEAGRLEVLEDERIVQMSSWSPNKENCIFVTSKSERLSMNNGETLSIWGQYRLQVHEGVIIVAGSFLAAGAPAVEVYAPSTSSIPVIKCIKFEGAVIEVFDNSTEEHTTDVLKRVSPLYSPKNNVIWGRVTDSQPSFFKVRHCIEPTLFS